MHCYLAVLQVQHLLLIIRSRDTFNKAPEGGKKTTETSQKKTQQKLHKNEVLYGFGQLLNYAISVQLTWFKVTVNSYDTFFFFLIKMIFKE